MNCLECYADISDGHISSCTFFRSPADVDREAATQRLVAAARAALSYFGKAFAGEGGVHDAADAADLLHAALYGPGAPLEWRGDDMEEIE